MHEVERICRKRQIDLTFLPRMIGLTEWKASTAAVRFEAADTMASLPSFTPPPFFRLKRWIDVLQYLVLMVLAFPLLLIGGLLVLLDVGPPIFFWQERLGWKGRSFLIYKFRTLSAPFNLLVIQVSGSDSLRQSVDFFAPPGSMNFPNC